MDGKWSIMKEYIEGKTLEQLMEENPDKTQEYMEQMVDLQLEIHSKACPLLNKLKEKTIRALNEEPELDESTRYELLTRLDGMPKSHEAVPRRFLSFQHHCSGRRNHVRHRLGSRSSG